MDSREELLRQQLVPPDGYDYEEDLSCGISSSCDWQSECSGEEVSSRCLESVSVGETDGAISRRWPTTSATGARVLRACDCIRVGVIVGIDSEPAKGVALAKEFASRGIMHIGIVGLDQRIVSKCASDIESGAHAPLFHPKTGGRPVCFQVSCVDHHGLFLTVISSQTGHHPGKDAFVAPVARQGMLHMPERRRFQRLYKVLCGS